MNLSHLTLTTGDIRMSPRSEVADATIAFLGPLIAPGTEWPRKIPALDGISIIIDRKNSGRALITLQGPAGRTCIICGLAWEADAGDLIWSDMMELARNEIVIAPMLRRPPLPWLAVMMTSHATTLPPDQLMMIADLERCIAWSILEDSK